MPTQGALIAQPRHRRLLKKASQRQARQSKRRYLYGHTACTLSCGSVILQGEARGRGNISSAPVPRMRTAPLGVCACG